MNIQLRTKRRNQILFDLYPAGLLQNCPRMYMRTATFHRLPQSFVITKAISKRLGFTNIDWLPRVCCEFGENINAANVVPFGVREWIRRSRKTTIVVSCTAYLV